MLPSGTGVGLTVVGDDGFPVGKGGGETGLVKQKRRCELVVIVYKAKQKEAH